jgi:hypothetical protein
VSFRLKLKESLCRVKLDRWVDRRMLSYKMVRGRIEVVVMGVRLKRREWNSGPGTWADSIVATGD